MTKKEAEMTKKQIILETIPDTVSRFMYYDRKDDEELAPGEIEDAISSGEITLDEIINCFRECLYESLSECLENSEKRG